MTDLSELIERVENLDGPDQRVEDDIRWYFSPWENLGGWWRRNKTTGEQERFTYSPPPPYTASLDAAMALAIRLLDNGSVDIECAYRVAAGQPLGRAYICGPHAESSAKAATPAIALLIATLRALQSQEAGNEG